MKVKVLKGFSTRALGKRVAGDVFEVPEGVKVQSLVNQGFLSGSRAEPTVDVAAETGTTSTAAPAAAGKAAKPGAKGKK